ncbi:MAG TPA: creatininase family protein [Pirellulaceae bacterium]|nr:creatininase family protein [Pirellulaceae bacterium]
MTAGVWLETLTWPEAKEKIDAGWPVVIPIGAIAKEHGHHLPLNTDYLMARELGMRVARRLPVIVAPVLNLGYYPAFVRYPGSQHLRPETFQALLDDVFSKFVRDGVRRLAVVNTGVSTEAPLRIAVREFYERTGVRVLTADVAALGRKTRSLMKQKLGGHGDEMETSIILAIDPAAVRMDRAVVDYGNQLDAPKSVFYVPTTFDGDPKTGPDYSVSGVRGDPTLATAEKGRAILDDMEEELVSGLRAAFPEAFR